MSAPILALLKPDERQLVDAAVGQGLHVVGLAVAVLSIRPWDGEVVHEPQPGGRAALLKAKARTAPGGNDVLRVKPDTAEARAPVEQHLRRRMAVLEANQAARAASSNAYAAWAVTNSSRAWRACLKAVSPDASRSEPTSRPSADPRP